MNLRQLNYFAKTVELGNITRAAEALNVAQPALGLQIRQLEQELEVPLLVRHSRGITPTRPGQVLYERACDILRRVEDAKAEITGYAGSEKESLILGITPGMTNVIGNTIYVDAPKALPDVHLSIVEEMSYVLIDALERDDIDLAIAYEVPDRPALLRTPLIEEELVFVAGPATVLKEGDSIDLQDLLGYKLVLADERDTVRRLLAAEAERLALPLRVAFEATSVSMMKSLVTRGEVASVMPRGTVAAELSAGQMVCQRIATPTITRTLYLARSVRHPRYRSEAEIADFLYDLVDIFVEKLHPLAHKL